MQKLIRAIILEDDIMAALSYEMALSELDVEVAATYKTWEEVLPNIKNLKPDLIIVDLMLGNSQSGLEFIKQIQKLFIPIVVVTGFPEKAQSDLALELGVDYFLTKPIDDVSLNFIFRKLIKKIEDSQYDDSQLVVKEKGRLIKIPYSNVVKMEIDGNYTTVVLDNGKKYVLKLSLLKVHEKLDPNVFLRCHRSTVVNFSFVTSLDVANNKFILKSGEEIAIGNRFRRIARKKFSDIQN